MQAKKPNLYHTMIGLFLMLLGTLAVLAGLVIGLFPVESGLPLDLTGSMSIIFITFGIFEFFSSSFLFMKTKWSYNFTKIILLIDLVLRATALLFGLMLGIFFLLSFIILVSQTLVIGKSHHE